MKYSKIIQTLTSPEYDFLRDHPKLNNNIILLGLGGSHSYGTNIETSDLDIRGVALNSAEEILTGNYFDQVTNEQTDTTIYSFRKIIHLLKNCNPNVIELLGLRPEDYLYIHPIGQQLINNSHLFLSKRAVHSFGSYANQQLRRLDNKSNQTASLSKQEQHILNTLLYSTYDLTTRYTPFPEDAIKLYIDESSHSDYETEVFADIHLTHYPLRDHKALFSEYQAIIKSYSKIGTRNSKAILHNKIGKHMMHLIRLYMMCIDILEKEEIITYRSEEHNLLMDIRNGLYLNEDNTPSQEFKELLNMYEKRFQYAIENTSLPEEPNFKRIEDFVMMVNRKIILDF